MAGGGGGAWWRSVALGGGGARGARGARAGSRRRQAVSRLARQQGARRGAAAPIYGAGAAPRRHPLTAPLPGASSFGSRERVHSSGREG